MESHRQAVVTAYWAQHRLSHGSRDDRLHADQYFWACEIVTDAAVKGDVDVVGLLDDLLHAEDADPVYLGAGPLEDLLHYHAAEFAGPVAQHCRRDAVWRNAVDAVYWPDDMPEAAMTLLRDFLRPPVERPDNPPPGPVKRAPRRPARGRGRRDR